MRSDEAITEDVLLRAKSLELKKEKRTKIFSSFCAVTLCCAFIIAAFVIPQAEVTPKTQSGLGYASIVYIGGQIGGYVLIAVAAFVLGVIATLVCLHLRNKKRGN